MNQRPSAIQIALNRRVCKCRSFLATTTVTTQFPVATHSTAERPRRVQGDWASADRYEPARHPALAGPRQPAWKVVLGLVLRNLKAPNFVILLTELVNSASFRLVGLLMLAGSTKIAQHSQ